MSSLRFAAVRASPALWIFLFAFALRLLVLIRLSGSPHFLPDGDDMKFYSDWAVRITQGQWTDHQAFYGLPGYAYVLALLYTLSGGPDPFLVGALQAALDAGTAVLLYQIALLAFAPCTAEASSAPVLSRQRVIGVLAGVGWACFQPALTFSTILMPTSWLVFAFWGCVWWLLRTRNSSIWKPWLVMGLIAGLVSMLVATILFLVPLMITAIILTVAREKPWTFRCLRVVAATLVLVSGLFIGASPAWLHNYFVAHEPVMLSAHSGINFWIGNNPEANGYPKMPPGIRASQEGVLKDSVTLAERAAGRNLKRVEVSQYWTARANDYIRDNASAWHKLMTRKFGNFWNAYQYDDLSIIKLLIDDGIVPPGLRFGIVAALGLAGLIPAVWRFPRARWIAAAVLLHMLALMPVFITERYRLAAVPGLLLLGSCAIWLLWDAIATNRWAATAGLFLTLVAAAWFVSIPRSEVSLWSLDFYKAGIRSDAAGDHAKALRNLETAFAYVPDNADVNFALGNHWLEQHDRNRAKLFYRRALELMPTHEGTLNNLGVLAMEEKRWPLAEKFFMGSLASEPDAAKTHYLLACVRVELGNADGARSALDRALHLRPAQKEFLALRERLDRPAESRPPSPPLPQLPSE